jgi:hypothetical protein
MADRYWVGGTANWDATAGTKWSATNGGAGGASVPTAADDVYFTLLSGLVTVTVSATANCRDLNFTGFIGTFAGSSIVNIAGSLTFSTGMTRSHTGAINFTAASGSQTITTAGKTFGGAVNIGSSGTSTATWTLQDAFISTTATNLTITSGTFSTNNFNVTVNSLISSNSNVRTINLGSSTITILAGAGALNLATATNLTFNAGTSQIDLTASGAAFSGGSQTFNNVSFTNNSSGSVSIGGVNSFNNLSFTGNTSPTFKIVNLSNNQTITGTFTVSAGTNATRRHFVRSDTVGTSRTLTCAAFSGTDIDFRDITIAGAAAPASGTRLGDCKGNSGITFGAGVPKYWNLATGGNWSATAWATGSGGTPAVNNFPLAQDSCVFENTGLNSGATINMDENYNVGTVNMSARTVAMSFQNNRTPIIHGDFINGTNVTDVGAGSIVFSGRNTQTITSAGRTFIREFTIDSISGTFLLADAFATSSSSTSAINVLRGTFDAAGYSVTVTGSVNTSSSNVRAIAFGSGTWTIGNSFNAGTAINLTVTGTGVISLTRASAKTFTGGGIQTYPTINQGGTGALTVTGSNKFTNITNSAIGSVLFTAGTTTTFDNFNLNGTSGNLLTIGSVTAANHTLSKVSGTVSSDYLSISRSTATGGAIWNAGDNSFDGGNNSGWIFSASPVAASSSMFLLF